MRLRGHKEHPNAKRPWDAQIDFTKGLGAPVGSALAGSKDFISQAWRWKHQFGGTKSGASQRQVDVDPLTMKLLKEFKRSSRSKFVVESDARPRIYTRYHHYRCDIHFKHLINWLRQQGITRRNALHELRKEFGTQVCQQFGIYASSRALGHSDIRTTAASYLDKKGRTAISMFKS